MLPERMLIVLRVRSTRLAACIACLLVLGLGATVRAQDHGQIAGTVKDSDGGVLVGATVTAVNVDTQLELVVYTGENGAYVITPVPVGFYDVAIELSGFRSFNVSRLKIDAAMRATVDAKLEIGQMADSVTVQASTATLQGETGQIGRMVDLDAGPVARSSGHFGFYVERGAMFVTDVTLERLD